jgi:hypothetical protein
MGDRREPDTQPGETRSTDTSTRDAEELDLTHVAEEWRRQTRQAGDQRNAETEGWLKALEAKYENPRNTFFGLLVHGCCWWSLMRLAFAVLLVVLVAAWVRRARG